MIFVMPHLHIDIEFSQNKPAVQFSHQHDLRNVAWVDYSTVQGSFHKKFCTWNLNYVGCGLILRK
jgi:hypothetical protein